MVNMIQSPENFVNVLNLESSSPGRVQIVASDAPARSALNHRPDYIVIPLVVAIDFTKGATSCSLTSFFLSLLSLLLIISMSAQKFVQYYRNNDLRTR